MYRHRRILSLSLKLSLSSLCLLVCNPACLSLEMSIQLFCFCFLFFFSHFCFQVIIAQLILGLLLLFLFTILSLALFMRSSRRLIDVSTQWMLASPLLPTFLDTYWLSISSLRCKALCVFMSFLVLLSISRNSSIVHLRNNPEYPFYDIPAM